MSPAIFGSGWAASFDAGDGWEARFVGDIGRSPFAVVYVRGTNGEPSDKRAIFATHLAAIDAVTAWHSVNRWAMLAALRDALSVVEVDGAAISRDTLIALVDMVPVDTLDLAAVPVGIPGESGLALRWEGARLVVAPAHRFTRLDLAALRPGVAS